MVSIGRSESPHYPRMGRSAAVLAFALIAVAGCGNSLADGPLQTLSARGEPVIDGGGIPVLPGQPADFTAFVDNTSGTPVTLLSASVIALPGFPAGHLAHAGVVVGHDMIGAGRGWPDGILTKPLPGARILHGQSNIIVGIIGTRIGLNYAAARIKITYKAGGHVFSVAAWSAGVACVRARVGPSYPGCSAAVDRAQTATCGWQVCPVSDLERPRGPRR